MKRKWKMILGVVLTVVILGFVFAEGTKGLQADLLQVKRGSIAKTFQEEGEVVSRVQRPIYPAYGGKIVDLPVKEGQEVKEGDLLAVIDSKELELQLEQLEAERKAISHEKLAVEQAQRELERARKNLERSRQLHEEGVITENEYEEAQDAVEAARTSLQQQRQYYAGKTEALEAQISLLKHKINECSITAPVSGVVSDLSVKKGEVVSPNSPIMTIFRQEAYEVEVYVLAEDVSRIEKDMKVQLIQDNREKDVRFEGIVQAIAPAAVKKVSALGLEEKRVKVTVVPVIPPTLKLRPGYALDVEFTTGKKNDKLVVPKTAMFPYENGKALWVVQNGKAKIQPVKTGFENERDVVIEEGLKEGDFVILNPQLEGLEEGKKVTAVRD